MEKAVCAINIEQDPQKITAITCKNIFKKKWKATEGTVRILFVLILSLVVFSTIVKYTSPENF